MSQTPSIGRIVVVQRKSMPEPEPAVITKVHSATVVDLTIFSANCGGIQQVTSVLQSDHVDDDTNMPVLRHDTDIVWNWPPRVPATPPAG